jgi:hypothetical protein
MATVTQPSREPIVSEPLTPQDCAMLEGCYISAEMAPAAGIYRVASLTFSYVQLGPDPAPQTVVADSTRHRDAVSPRCNYRLGRKLAFRAGGGLVPTILTVSVNPTGLRPGTYTGTIRVDAVNHNGNTVAVTLVVTAGAALTVSPIQMSFVYQQLGPAPAAQQLTIGSSPGAPLPYSASPAPGAPWLQASGVGTTPSSLNVSVSPAGLNPGTYTGSIVITSNQASNSRLPVPITLTVSPAPKLQACAAFSDRVILLGLFRRTVEA